MGTARTGSAGDTLWTMIRAMCIAVVLIAPVLSGCHSLSRGGGGELEIRSIETGATLTPALRTAIYKRVDPTTADLYFSDLPESRLTDASDDLFDAAGSILHIHYFLEPSPGNTPIDDTACNVTVRNVIIAPAEGSARGSTPGQVFGIYGGGGFFFPSGTIGESTFGGSMNAGTHRLLHESPGFKDVLGPATIGGKLTASRDDAAANAIQARIERMLQTAHALETPR